MNTPNPVRPPLDALIEGVISEARKVMTSSNDLYERRLAKTIINAGYMWRRARRDTKR